MSIPKIAVIVTLIGAVGLVLSSLVHASAVDDFVFNAAAVCLVGGPLIFFGYVFTGLCIDVAHADRIPEVRIAALVPSAAVPVVPRSAVTFDEWVPQGLRRGRKGPLNRSTGRANKI